MKNCGHDGDSKEDRIKRIEKLLNSDLKPKQRSDFDNQDFKKEWESAYNECCGALKRAQEILEKYKK